MSIFQQNQPWLSNNIQDQIESYLSDCKARRLSEKTLHTYKFYLNWFEEYSKQINLTDVTKLNSTLCRNYMQWVQVSVSGRKRSPYTIHAAFRVLRSFCSFLVQEEVLDKNPISTLKAPKLPKEILPALTNDEIERVINHLSSWKQKPRHQRTGLDLFLLRNLALFLFMLDTGARVEEVASIKYGQVDFVSGRVYIKSGKGEKDRIVFLSQVSLKYLKEYLKIIHPLSQSSLWIGQCGELSSQGIRMIYKRLSQSLGIQISPHKIRRTFAIQMLRNGADIYRLKDLMGHSDLRTLERYLQIEEDDLKSVHESCSPVLSQRGLRRM